MTKLPNDTTDALREVAQRLDVLAHDAADNTGMFLKAVALSAECRRVVDESDSENERLRTEVGALRAAGENLRNALKFAMEQLRRYTDVNRQAFAIAHAALAPAAPVESDNAAASTPATAPAARRCEECRFLQNRCINPDGMWYADDERKYGICGPEGNNFVARESKEGGAR